MTTNEDTMFEQLADINDMLRLLGADAPGFTVTDAHLAATVPYVLQGLGSKPAMHPCKCSPSLTTLGIIKPLLGFLRLHGLAYHWDSSVQGLEIFYAPDAPSLASLEELAHAGDQIPDGGLPFNIVKVLHIHGITCYCTTGHSLGFRLLLDATVYTQRLDTHTRHKWDFAIPKPTMMDKLRKRTRVLNPEMCRIMADEHYHTAARQCLACLNILLAQGGEKVREQVIASHKSFLPTHVT